MVSFSIVVPTMNQAGFIEATLESIWTQNHEPREILVIDGGSTDGTVDILERWSDRLAYWTSGPDGGQAAAIRTGLARATGDVLTWLNSDDLLLPGALTRVAREVQRQREPAAVLYGGHEVIDAEGPVRERFPGVPVIPWIALAAKPAICQPGTFWTRAAYDRVAGVDPRLHYSMDLDLWMQFLHAGVPFRRVPGMLAQFRRHGEQKGRTAEWLAHCLREEAILAERYGMPSRRSARWKSARLAQRIMSVVSGHAPAAAAFRLIREHRLAEYFPA